MNGLKENARLKFITQKAIKPGPKNTTQMQVMLIDKSKQNKREYICPQFYCFLLLKINKRHTLTSCIFLFFLFKKTIHIFPKSKVVNTQIKRKTNCNHKVCCYLFRKHMIVILEGHKKKKQKKTSKITGTLKVING
jgi:hypothetical protein